MIAGYRISLFSVYLSGKCRICRISRAAHQLRSSEPILAIRRALTELEDLIDTENRASVVTRINRIVEFTEIC